MRKALLHIHIISMTLLFIVVSAAARQAPGDLSKYLPEKGKVAGWKPDDAPQYYRGEELFMMINGGADIYHEYGFRQVVRARYMDAGGKLINLEIYEMESPTAAYGIYTFKTGENGKALPIGKEALLEEYYLNFWKSDLLVTVVGEDAEEGTIQGIVAIAKAVDARIVSGGERPELAELLLGEPFGFARPKYVRGLLGVMGSYIFDTENIFQVREGMIGGVGGCQAFVFRYADHAGSVGAFKHAAARLKNNSKFKGYHLEKNRCEMTGRDNEFIVINQAEPYIIIVIGKDREKARSTSIRFA